jgi:hypothetical protein
MRRHRSCYSPGGKTMLSWPDAPRGTQICSVSRVGKAITALPTTSATRTASWAAARSAGPAATPSSPAEHDPVDHPAGGAPFLFKRAFSHRSTRA